MFGPLTLIGFGRVKMAVPEENPNIPDFHESRFLGQANYADSSGIQAFAGRSDQFKPLRDKGLTMCDHVGINLVTCNLLRGKWLTMLTKLGGVFNFYTINSLHPTTTLTWSTWSTWSVWLNHAGFQGDHVEIHLVPHGLLVIKPPSPPIRGTALSPPGCTLREAAGPMMSHA